MRSVSNFLLVTLFLISFISLSIFVIPAPLLSPEVASDISVECDEGYGKCAVLGEESPSCGDGSCNGFENCETCELDCGVCSDHEPWWQVWGGHLFAAAETSDAISSEIPSIMTCIEPACFPFVSSVDRDSNINSDGFLFTGGGDISADGWLTYRDPNTFAQGTKNTRLRETYSFFHKQYSLGLSPVDQFFDSFYDAQKPTEIWDYYFRDGDLTVQSPWSVASGESFVIIVDGDLSIEDPGTVGELITVDEGGFLAFIVSGDINIDENVGHSTLTNTTGNIEGIYVADGNINILSNGGLDKKFIGEGTFVGWSGVNLNRDFNAGVDNDSQPTETFIYRPDFIKNLPEKMLRSQMIRQEV